MVCCNTQTTYTPEFLYVRIGGFFQKVLTHLSFPFIFLSLKILIMVTEICLEI
jgi:hypothetical protein